MQGSYCRFTDKGSKDIKILKMKMQKHFQCTGKSKIFGELGNPEDFRFPENFQFSRTQEMQSISLGKNFGVKF